MVSWREKLGMWALKKQPGANLVSRINGHNGRSTRGTRQLLEMYYRNPWFHAVVRRVSWAAAVVPFQLYAVRRKIGVKDMWSTSYTKGSDEEFVKHTPLLTASNRVTRNKLVKGLCQNERIREIECHPLLDLLAYPNPDMTGLTMKLVTLAHLNIRGEAFWVLSFDATGAPSGIWPISPHMVTQTPTQEQPWYEVNLGRTTRHFEPKDIIWMKHPDLTDPYGRGVGTGTTLVDELDTDEYMASFQATFFQSRGRPDLIMSAEGVTQDALHEAKGRFEAEHRDMTRGGSSFWHKGNVDVQVLSQPMVDSEVVSQRSWIRDLVISVFGVPPEALGIITDSNRATAREARGLMAEFVTEPQLEHLRSELQHKLVPLFDERLVLDFVSPVPEDREFQLNAMASAPEMATRGEWRALQGLQDRGEVDNIHMTPTTPVVEEGPPLNQEALSLTLDTLRQDDE